MHCTRHCHMNSILAQCSSTYCVHRRVFLDDQQDHPAQLDTNYRDLGRNSKQQGQVHHIALFTALYKKNAWYSTFSGGVALCIVLSLPQDCWLGELSIRQKDTRNIGNRVKRCVGMKRTPPHATEPWVCLTGVWGGGGGNTKQAASCCCRGQFAKGT